MEHQRFIPEGWEENNQEFNESTINLAYKTGDILQGYVNACDSSYNLHINLGNNINGIIPRNELEALNVDEFGFCNPSICKNKVNNFVQFKVKEIYDDNVILSRKKVQQEALDWVKNDLKPGMIVNGIVKNIRKFRSFCRNRWRSSWTASHRGYFSIKDKITRRKI